MDASVWKELGGVRVQGVVCLVGGLVRTIDRCWGRWPKRLCCENAGVVVVIMILQHDPAVLMGRIPGLHLSSPVEDAVLAESNIHTVSNSHVQLELCIYTFWARRGVYFGRLERVKTVERMYAAEVGDVNRGGRGGGVVLGRGLNAASESEFPAAAAGRTITEVHTVNVGGDSGKDSIEGGDGATLHCRCSQTLLFVPLVSRLLDVAVPLTEVTRHCWPDSFLNSDRGEGLENASGIRLGVVGRAGGGKPGH